MARCVCARVRVYVCVGDSPWVGWECVLAGKTSSRTKWEIRSEYGGPGRKT